MVTETDKSIKINQPGAVVVIYNYNDRLGDISISKNKDDVFKIDEIILNSSSLISVSTQKSKSSPTGHFEFRLAPTRNWVTAITPGSWCMILMSNKSFKGVPIVDGKVDEKTFKMIGRIESARGVASVNQVTGAIQTEYIVTGVDWGTVFDSKFYVDPLNRSPNEQPQGMASRFGYNQYLIKAFGFSPKVLGDKANPTVASGASAKANKPENKNAVDYTKSIINSSTTANVEVETPTDSRIKLPSSIDNINFLIDLWGNTDKVTKTTQDITGIVTKSKQVFTIPDQLVKYMGLVDNVLVDEPSGLIADVIVQKGGKLQGPDDYDNKDQSCGIIDFSTILGEHTVWQLLTSNSNSVINELIPEVRFEQGVPALTLYNRVRPFTVNQLDVIKKDTNSVGDDGVPADNSNSKFVGPPAPVSYKADVDPFLSQYKWVRQKRIAIKDVIACSYGTNWRDRINFIEVHISSSLYQETYSSSIKLDAQFVDEASISRDGLLSMMIGTSYLPKSGEVHNPLGVKAYKYALKEWYFNTHKMFNGTLSLIGQDQYIQVGDNIKIDSKILNRNQNINADSEGQTFLLAHVESVSHQVGVDINGNRTFKTDINFVRGIIVDDQGNMVVASGSGAVDQDSSLTSVAYEKNKETKWKSSAMDPDAP